MIISLIYIELNGDNLILLFIHYRIPWQRVATPTDGLIIRLEEPITYWLIYINVYVKFTFFLRKFTIDVWTV